ncbi:hypothetical protein B0H17DRAFT_1195313 [Mycena rosella]|uniref:Uncharacterized protein n=1 Tax=Mycena rosella TaxID=1033263 RepID=A0AAD7DZC6_MYCRO|nr:hypothetical protein B0H17DRAFT_1195313 [Mycena rosella]
MHGRTGLMLVMATLFWWGLTEDRAADVEARKQWLDVVADVRFVMQELVSSGELKTEKTKGGKKGASTNKAGPKQKRGTKSITADDGDDNDEEDEEEDQADERTGRRSNEEDEGEAPAAKKRRITKVVPGHET